VQLFFAEVFSDSDPAVVADVAEASRMLVWELNDKDGNQVGSVRWGNYESFKSISAFRIAGCFSFPRLSLFFSH
jgi:hypothetical protein